MLSPAFFKIKKPGTEKYLKVYSQIFPHTRLQVVE
jgi:hypothetical protein